jgi:predicted permease
MPDFECWRDIHYAARLYRKSPGFAVITTLLLALGIAANTILFSVVDALLLRPLPVNRPEELVRLIRARAGLAAPQKSDFLYPVYTALKGRTEIFVGILGQVELNIALTDGIEPERIRAHLVTGNFFSLLGVQALYGRVLLPDDERYTSDTPPVVLSYAFWKRRFNADTRVIGRSISLQGHRCVIIGVTPEEFNGISADTSPDVRVPFTSVTALSPDRDYNRVEQLEYELIGRLHPRMTIGSAQAACAGVWDAVMESLRSDPNAPTTQIELQVSRGIELQPAARGVSSLRTQFSTALLCLMIAAGLLLMMVCANVAGLLLARSAARRQEITIRAAVGASRARLIRQMMTESALLSLFGAIGGLLAAFASMPFVVRLLPPIRHIDGTILPLSVQIRPDPRILGFSLAVSALTVLLFGLGPAFHAARADLYSSLKTARSSRSAGRYGLVILQVGLCAFLLTAAGLLLNTFERLRHLDAGFDRDRVITFSADPRMRQYSPERQRALEARLLENVRALPGVDSAAIASRGLMRGAGFKMTFVLPGQKAGPPDYLNASTNSVSPDYFSTMGMHFTAGRNYTASEPLGARPQPRVVNEAFARLLFPGLDPLGRLFGSKGEYQIAGVVSNAKYRSLREPVPPTVYSLWGPGFKMVESFILHVRTRARPESIVRPVNGVMRSMDPQLPFYEIKTLAEEVESSLWSERLVAGLASAFAVIATLLAGIGIYGLLSYTVAQRTHEIGIRMALGAMPLNILNLVSLRVAALVAGGIALGAAGSAATAQWIAHLLYGVSARDAATMSAAAIFVVFIAAAATAIPVARAISIEPVTALRQES